MSNVFRSLFWRFTRHKAPEFYEKGNTCANEGKYDEAIKNYTEAIRRDPKNALAYKDRGKTYLAMGDKMRALQDCNRAIELDPEFAMAYNNRGYCFSLTGDTERALPDYAKAIELDPNLVLAHGNRARLWFDIGEFSRSVSDYGRWMELGGDQYAAHVNRGLAELKCGEIDAAIEDFNKAIQLRPDEPNNYINRAAALFEKGEYRKALKDLDLALQRNPGSPNVVQQFRKRICRAEDTVGSPDAYVAECFRIGFTEEDDSRDPFMSDVDPLVEAFNAGKIEEARQHALALKEQYSDWHLPYTWLGMIYTRKSEYDEGKKTLTEGLQLARSKYGICTRLGDLAWDAGELTDAVKWWLRSVLLQVSSHRLKDAFAFLRLACVAEILGDAKAASSLRNYVDRIKKVTLDSRAVQRFQSIVRQHESTEEGDSVREAIRQLDKWYL